MGGGGKSKLMTRRKQGVVLETGTNFQVRSSEEANGSGFGQHNVGGD
jgi:hypothetical protein